jgi:hypothetical protein
LPHFGPGGEKLMSGFAVLLLCLKYGFFGPVVTRLDFGPLARAGAGPAALIVQ